MAAQKYASFSFISSAHLHMLTRPTSRAMCSMSVVAVSAMAVKLGARESGTELHGLGETESSVSRINHETCLCCLVSARNAWDEMSVVAVHRGACWHAEQW